MPLVKDAIRAAGGAPAVAAAFGLKRSTTYDWGRTDRIPGNWVLKVSEMGGYAVTPHELAPDLYPNPTDGLPELLSR